MRAPGNGIDEARQRRMNTAGAQRDVAVVVAAHRPYRMPDDPLYLPVQVGAAGKPSIEGFQRDDEGDNISAQNVRYCELTGLYWAWKNLDVDYLGFCQYRRHFSYRKKGADDWGNMLTLDEARELCSKNMIVLPRKRNYYIQTLKQHFEAYSFAEPGDVGRFREAVNSVDPSYLGAFDAVMARRSGHMCSMFLMEKGLADEYCSWLFEVLRSLDAAIGPGRNRMLGYFGEHGLDIWIERNGLPCREIDAIYLDRDNELRKRVGYLMRILGLKEQSDKFVKRQR